MNLVVVTPIHNEARNIGILAEQMANSSRHPDVWIIVNDGSTDSGADVVRGMKHPFPTVVLDRDNRGGLIGGSAFTAWQHGVDYAMDHAFEFDAVMKLDADVELDTNYLEQVVSQLAASSKIGLVGGVLTGRADREQIIHVPGPVKLYSRAGYEALQNLHRAVGFDVMDELAIKRAGLRVEIRKDLPFRVRRAIGASQGLVHGRRRNGVVCRWTGYWGPYFALHAFRYVFRQPYLIGSIAMVYGYARADQGPYSEVLRKDHAREQQMKIGAAIRAPRSWLRDVYGIRTGTN